VFSSPGFRAQPSILPPKLFKQAPGVDILQRAFAPRPERFLSLLGNTTDVLFVHE